MVEAIVVLGAGLQADGTISQLSKQRLDAAIKTYRHHPCPLILSGKWTLLSPTEYRTTEAAAMKTYARSQGIPPADILLEPSSMDTAGNAYFVAKEFLTPRGWRHILVVTSDFHEDRAKYLFRHILGRRYTIRVLGAPSHLDEATSRAKQNLESSLIVFYKELLQDVPEGDLAATFTALSTLPGYNPEPEYSREALIAITRISADDLAKYGVPPPQGSTS